MIAGGWYHHNIETAVDRSLPFVPQFLIIYFGCYLFWIVNYILIARQDQMCIRDRPKICLEVPVRFFM